MAHGRASSGLDAFANFADYFPDDHVTFRGRMQSRFQIGGMYKGDRSRKTTLVDFGFRFSRTTGRQVRGVRLRQPRWSASSATPGDGAPEQIVEQIIRPTGLVDPEIEVRPRRLRSTVSLTR